MENKYIKKKGIQHKSIYIEYLNTIPFKGHLTSAILDIIYK